MSEFKPEDFYLPLRDDEGNKISQDHVERVAALIANARLAELLEACKKQWLEELLKDAPFVSSSNEVEPPLHTWFKVGIASDVYMGDEKIFAKSTHRARLVQIEEIKLRS